jgi:RecB family endonuclease NucS
MAIYEITDTSIIKLEEVSLISEGILERRDLQRLLKESLEVIAPDCLLVTEEFGEWQDSKRRIDLLCLDRDANLVLIELKRTDE